MSIDLGQLLTPDLNTSRFIIVASVVAGFAVYAWLRLTAAGTLTGGYLVLLAILGQWQLLIAMVFTVIVCLIIVRRVMTRWFALSRVWISLGLMIASTVIMSILTLTLRVWGPITLPGGVSFALLVGSYILPGVMAYDFAHQGFLPTLTGLGLVMAGTLVLSVPVLVVANVLSPTIVSPYVPGFGRIPSGMVWLATLAAVLMGAALRLSYGLRVGGFVASLFIVQLFSIPALLTIPLAAIATKLIVDRIHRYVVLTERQRFQVSLLIGMMVSWTSLYWASTLGWAPAMGANSYALQPLLAVGLLAADMGRRTSSIGRTLVGVGLCVAFIELVLFAATSGGWTSWVATAIAVVGIPVLLAVPGGNVARREWANAVTMGERARALISPLGKETTDRS